METNTHSDGIKVIIADASHEIYVDEILDTISAAAKVRGTGIAKRTHEYVAQKMREGKAVIALSEEGEFAGFCYIESWGNKQYVANSGLIVNEKFRRHGLAKRIKKRAFDLSREKWPNAKLFGLTSGGAVMKINTELGYVPVPFSELTDDEEELAEMTMMAVSIAKSIDAEGKIENLIKAKGFEECLVYINDTKADVIVKTEGLLSSEAAVIKDIILDETEIAAENIKILEVK